jgi:hypothetical protein
LEPGEKKSMWAPYMYNEKRSMTAEELAQLMGGYGFGSSIGI